MLNSTRSQMQNFSTTRNHTVNSMLKSLIASIAVALAAATPAFASIEWQFTTADNPATPEIGDPSATASITVGDFGTGWQDISGLGSATGCWDLGMNGSVTLTIPNLASPISAHNATLSIVQWVDDFLFTGSLLYSVSGATQVGGTTTHLIEHPDPAGAPGEWVQYDTVWNLLASASPTT